MRLHCPQCQMAFDFGSQEYCHHDGERLVLQNDAASEALEPEGGQPEAKLDQEEVPEIVSVTSSEPDVPPPSAERGPQGAPSSALDNVKELFARFGIRQKDNPNPRAEQIHASTTGVPEGASHDDADNPLPEALREAGWVVAGPSASDVFADAWPVERQGVPARFSRFRATPLTSPDLYRALRESTSAALPAVLEFGTVDLRGHAHAAFDLVVLPQSTQTLDIWLQTAPASEAKALALLPPLVEMLSELANAGFAPVSMEPAHILRRSDGRLMLSHVAALTSPSESPHYTPELDRSPLISRLFSAPELAEQLMVHPNKACVYSAGQILATALWGQAIDLAALRAGELPVQGLESALLARVLQGSLWTQSLEGRWGIKDLTRALNAADESDWPSVEDWGRVGPLAMKNAFAMGGKTYWRVETLMEAVVAPEVWPQALARIDFLFDWLQNGSTWASAAAMQREALQQGRQTADHTLLRLVRQIRPDLPLTWRSLNLEDATARDNLLTLAQRVLAAGATPQDGELIRDLFRADLRGAFLPPA